MECTFLVTPTMKSSKACHATAEYYVQCTLQDAISTSCHVSLAKALPILDLHRIHDKEGGMRGVNIADDIFRFLDVSLTAKSNL